MGNAAALKNVGRGCTLFLSCSCLPVFPRKELIHLYAAMIFATAAEGTQPDCLAKGASLLMVSQDYIDLHGFLQLRLVGLASKQAVSKC